MSSTMLSIIIVNYNTRELLKQCLQSLRIHNPLAEVIVVDNASSDGSPEMIRIEFPDAKLVPLDKNLGFAGGNNVGLQNVNGDTVLLLNSDTYLEDDTLDRCAAWMRLHPYVGAASPWLIGFDGIPQRCAHPFPSFRKKLRSTLRLAPDEAPETVEDGAGWLIGAALMIRRDALRQLDGFLDTSYFMYWEDTDLCSRLLLAGYSLSIFNEGHVRHLGGASSNSSKGRQRSELQACFLRGKYRWFRHYRPTWELAGLWALDSVEAARKFLRGIFYRRRWEYLQSRIQTSVLLRSVCKTLCQR